ncbi:unnamed protein product [Macrosiphum euphorbiae]|uniref:Uncharacterized protein n=1 Tax=Macrosiphum euphorbiae TaxID=13131 RepID=A0AAV0WS29_9HEMI|nr:unnamed protein product [Macrosiphum euphorbiae]
MTRCSSGGDGVLNLQARNDNCPKRCVSPTASSEFRSIYLCLSYINHSSMMPMIDAALQYCLLYNFVFCDVFSSSSVSTCQNDNSILQFIKSTVTL